MKSSVWKEISRPSVKANLLPEELLVEEIIMNSDDPTIISFCNINKKFQNICNNDEFWLRLYYKHFSKTGTDEGLDFINYKDLFRMTFVLYNLKNLLNYNSIKQLYYADNIDLSNKNLDKFPLGLLELYYSETVNLSDNYIKILPDEIDKMINLTELDLSLNNISVLPINFYFLTNLTFLDLRNNRIEIINDNIGKLLNLEYLNLSSNMILRLPDTFYNLIKLKFLNLSFNQITNISYLIGKLRNLLILDIQYNKIKSIPNDINKLISLDYLILNNNSIKKNNISFDDYYSKYLDTLNSDDDYCDICGYYVNCNYCMNRGRH